jgi:rhodanese-related sulfurtransferase
LISQSRGLGDVYKRQSDDEARRRIAQGATILDVRSDPEFALSHYPSSVHIPVDRIDSQIQGIIPSKSQSIVIYCRTGYGANSAEQSERHGARIAAEHLQRLGYSNVAYITGSL